MSVDDDEALDRDLFDESAPMSDAERRMADRVAQLVMARLILIAQDKKRRKEMLAGFGDDLDQAIGKGVRRFVIFIVGVLLAMAALRFGILERVLKSIAGP